MNKTRLRENLHGWHTGRKQNRNVDHVPGAGCPNGGQDAVAFRSPDVAADFVNRQAHCNSRICVEKEQNVLMTCRCGLSIGHTAPVVRVGNTRKHPVTSGILMRDNNGCMDLGASLSA